MPKRQTRTRAPRMSPEVRREQILESAVQLIVAQGLSRCTLEGVAEQAAISKPLIYKYFPRREDLLKALLEREYRYLGARGLGEVPRDMSLEELLRRSTLHAMEYLYERGPIMRLLASDRAVSDLAQRQDRDERSAITDYFTKRMMRVYGIPKDVAAVCAIMAVNAPILSARTLKRRGISAQRAAEVWSAFIIGGNRALQRNFATAKPPKKRAPSAPKAKQA